MGRITNSFFNRQNKSIEFEAQIMDEEIKKMISDGRITNISIGAKVRDLEKQKDGTVIARGIEGLELSLVAVPGDAGANISQAIENSFKIKESLEKEEKLEIEETIKNYCDERIIVRIVWMLWRI